jgi:glutamate-1-semialdehyde 2,1-aminomutase
MKQVAPSGNVYQAGTLSGNPIAMAAGLATLTELKNHPEIYANMAVMTARLAEGIRQTSKYTVNNIGSLLTIFFTEQPVYDYATAKSSDTHIFAAYFQHMLANSVYVAPSQFEALFVSAAHTDADIDQTINIVKTFRV